LTRRRGIAALAALLATSAVVALFSSSALAWKPGPERYGMGERKNVPVQMEDGTVLRANVYYPTDPQTAAAADGHFPVIMVQTPYGKDAIGAASGQDAGPQAATEAGPLPYMIKRGYIDVVADVRGTGDSHGTFGLFDPVQGRDGATLVRWAAGLPHSDGKVGLYGPSYMGINEFLTAKHLGPNSPLKALFPIVAANDIYRDTAFMGGIADGEFDLLVVFTIFGGLHLVNPAIENPTDVADLLRVESEHAPSLLSYSATQVINVLTGGDQAYAGKYWRKRSPRSMLDEVVDNRIPAFMVGGWFDLFQRGGPMNYSGLQNLDRGRDVEAPMDPEQKPTSRYQLLFGPWYHLDAGAGLDIYPIELAWFDHWLEDEHTGITSVESPLHAYMLGANRWVDAKRYPFPEGHPRPLYLGSGPSGSHAPSTNDGTLTPDPPDGANGADPIAYLGATSPCSRGTEQWSMGALAFALETAQAPEDRCTTDDRTLQAGPGALTYTTAPFDSAKVLDGPIAARIYATSTRPETELVATLEDVSPDGSSAPLTSGALLGSFRDVDSERTWRAPNGNPTLPYHPYSKSSVKPVTPGKVTRYDIEIFPTLAELAQGHRLRLTITTSDTPHLLPSPAQSANLAGGVYQVQRNKSSASYIEVPLADPDAFQPCDLCK
jgi:putative CocE/NonD family hydrolase